MVPNITPIMENQMEKKLENEMETGIITVVNRDDLSLLGRVEVNVGVSQN